MKIAISILLGLPLFIYFVANPIRANLIASVALTSDIDPKEQLKVLAVAYGADPCSIRILTLIGDTATIHNVPRTAIWAFGNAMECSPADGMIRFKYGATLHNLGYDGNFALEEALMLEPHNPLFRSTLGHGLSGK